MKLNPYLIPYMKINSEWIKDVNIRSDTVKLLEENMEEKLHDIDLGNDFSSIVLLSNTFFFFFYSQNLLVPCFWSSFGKQSLSHYLGITFPSSP